MSSVDLYADFDFDFSTAAPSLADCLAFLTSKYYNFNTTHLPLLVAATWTFYHNYLAHHRATLATHLASTKADLETKHGDRARELKATVSHYWWRVSTPPSLKVFLNAFATVAHTLVLVFVHLCNIVVLVYYLPVSLVNLFLPMYSGYFAPHPGAITCDRFRDVLGIHRDAPITAEDYLINLFATVALCITETVRFLHFANLLLLRAIYNKLASRWTINLYDLYLARGDHELYQHYVSPKPEMPASLARYFVYTPLPPQHPWRNVNAFKCPEFAAIEAAAARKLYLDGWKSRPRHTLRSYIASRIEGKYRAYRERKGNPVPIPMFPRPWCTQEELRAWIRQQEVEEDCARIKRQWEADRIKLEEKLAWEKMRAENDALRAQGLL